MYSCTKSFLAHGLLFALAACGQWANDRPSPETDSAQPAPANPLLQPVQPLLPEPVQPVLPVQIPQTNDDSGAGEDDASDAGDFDSPPMTAAPVKVSDLPSLSSAAAAPVGMVLHEGSAAADFAAWIADPKNQNTLSQIGVLDSAAGVLSLNGPVTLSFSSFATGGSFLIKTNGHDISIVGSDFGYLKIDSSQNAGHSGHVRIYSTSKVLPSVVTSGSKGSGGIQGDCPADLSCAGLGELIARRPYHGPSVGSQNRVVETSWDWSDKNMPEVIRQQALAGLPLATESFLKQHCSLPATMPWFDGPFISGKVKFTQVISDPVVSGELSLPKPLDAVLYSGTRGGAGYDGGNVTLVHLGEEDKNWMETVAAAGGEGGLGGRNLMSPASEGTDEVRRTSTKFVDRLQLQNISTEYRVSCRTFGTVPHLWQVKVALPPVNREVAAQSDTLPDSKTVVLPAVAAGRDLPPDTPHRAGQGPSGKSGQREILRAQSVQQWKTALHPDVPLPQIVQMLLAGK